MRRRVLNVLWVLLAIGLLVVVVLPRALPRVLSWAHPDIVFRGPTDAKRLYVTIDDAPSNATAEILAVLKKHNVPATFFVIGNRVKSAVQLVAIRESGHAIGHHMRTTERCSVIPLRRFEAEFDYTDQLIRGTSTPTYFRPPSDFGTAEQLAYVKSKGYQPVLGTVFPLDHWIQQPVILETMIEWLAVPGGVLIMHDGDGRGATTARVLDRVLPSLKHAGYQFAPLPPAR